MTEDIVFKFQDLEITSTKLAISFYEEKIVVLLKDIESYHLQWYLHEPIFGKKWWYLVLTIDRENGLQVCSGRTSWLRRRAPRISCADWCASAGRILLGAGAFTERTARHCHQFAGPSTERVSQRHPHHLFKYQQRNERP